MIMWLKKKETVNHISEYGKLVPNKLKTRHGMAEKVMCWELSKRLKFSHSTKWYMHKPDSFLKNVMYKTRWDFEI